MSLRIGPNDHSREEGDESLFSSSSQGSHDSRYHDNQRNSPTGSHDDEHDSSEYPESEQLEDIDGSSRPPSPTFSSNSSTSMHLDPDTDRVNTPASDLTSLEDAEDAESMDFMEPTQPATQLEDDDETVALRNVLWGYLEPLNRQLPRLEFRRSQKIYKIGRTDLPAVGNHYVLPDPRISNLHCMITWDGREDTFASVEVSDLSSNGTFINGRRIGRGAYDKLKDGDILAFGSPHRPQNGDKANPQQYDNRYEYHHTASHMNVISKSGKRWGADGR